MSFDVRTEYQDLQTAESYDKQRFDSLSGRVFQWAERRALDRIVRLFPPDSRVLDAPCGTGRLMDIFLRRGFMTVGGDISAQMLHVAKRRSAEWKPRAVFARMDFAEMPLADDSITVVCSIRFLVHVSPEERLILLREFQRVARRWVVISVSLSTPWHRLRRWIKARLGHPKPVRHPVTNRALAQELGRAGLREVRRRWTFPVFSEQVFVVCERA
jgi:ubiquinone/menaquinone biosynthesis C-methylase UbiE